MGAIDEVRQGQRELLDLMRSLLVELQGLRTDLASLHRDVRNPEVTIDQGGDRG